MNDQRKILDGIRVIDISRLAPGPYGSMLLADMGAEVIVIGGGPGGPALDTFGRGKSFVELDLKTTHGLAAFKRLVAASDVLIEGFRPGVCDRLGIGYAAMREVNERLIFCSLTGYGQDGPLAQEAGHDINYLGMSGALGAMGPADAAPALPLNLVADFAAGGLYAAFAIVSALFERERSGKGQSIDIAMVDGCISLMAMHYPDWGQPVLPERGKGLLTGEAPFYRCHRCADGRHVAVGALERKFFESLWEGLGLDGPAPDNMRRAGWGEMNARFEQVFATRTRDEWVRHFAGRDACVSPVLAPDEVFAHPQNAHRHPEAAPSEVPAIPRFSRSLTEPGRRGAASRSGELLASLGLTEAEIAGAMPQSRAGAAGAFVWPPVRD